MTTLSLMTVLLPVGLTLLLVRQAMTTGQRSRWLPPIGLTWCLYLAFWVLVKNILATV